MRRIFWEEVPATLTQFPGWAFTGRISPHKCEYEHALIWTAPRYIAEHEGELERHRRREAALLRGQARWTARKAGIPVSRAVAIMTGLDEL